jgi:hypothetical protein
MDDRSDQNGCQALSGAAVSKTVAPQAFSGIFQPFLRDSWTRTGAVIAATLAPASARPLGIAGNRYGAGAQPVGQGRV